MEYRVIYQREGRIYCNAYNSLASAKCFLRDRKLKGLVISGINLHNINYGLTCDLTDRTKELFEDDL